MPTAKLTKRAVDAARPEAAEYILWDTDLAGFGLRVTPRNQKSYVLLYRVGGGRGRQRKPTLAKHGVITVEQARQMARDWLLRARNGEDPSLDRHLSRTSLVMNELCDRYLTDHARVRNKSSTVQGAISMLNQHVRPSLGRLRICDVTRDRVTKVHHEMKATPYHANRCLALLNTIFNLAETWGLSPPHSNPCRGIRKYRESSRERHLSEEEIRALHEALRAIEPAAPHMVALFRLLLLTGARLNEIASLAWAHVDYDAGFLRLPDSKTGKKTIRITDPIRQVLQSIPRLEGNPWVIAGRRPGSHVVGVQKFWQRLRVDAGLPDVRIHDLRHSFASIALREGLSLPAIGKLLGHTRITTTARYAHLADEALNASANQVASRISRIMTGGVPAQLTDAT